MSEVIDTVPPVNCASELAALLDSWAMRGTSPWERRRETFDGDELATWRGQVHAAVLLSEVDAALTALRGAQIPTLGFDPYVVEWHRAVFSYESPWLQSGGGAAVRDEALNGLLTLGVFLDLNALPAVDETRRAALLTVLDDAERVLGEEGEHLTPTEREYLFRLVSGARSYVAERERRGEAELRDHVDRLAGALLGMAAKLREAGETGPARRFFRTALRVAATGRTGLYDLAAIATIAGVTVQAITAH